MPELAETKRGRPRQYRLQALPHFASPEVGFAAAALDELRERVVDQIADLSTETLAYVPEGTTLSIAALVVHLVWAEAGWIERVTGVSAPADLRAQIDGVGRAVPAGRRASLSMAAPELVALCRRVRDALTAPALAQLRDPRRAHAPHLALDLSLRPHRPARRAGGAGICVDIWRTLGAWMLLGSGCRFSVAERTGRTTRNGVAAGGTDH